MNAGEDAPPRRARNARLLIVDDNDLARAGISSLLGCEPGLEIVGEAVNGRQAVDLCLRLQPDLVLLDIRMPEMDGLTATRAIKTHCPLTSIIILTMHESAEYLLAAVDAGAAGYLLKDITRKELIAAVRDVLSGRVILNGAMAADLIRRLPRRQLPADGGPLETLTQREVEVLHLLALGLSNREIGAVLTITAGTAKIHVERILSKLGVSDRTQAAVRAVECGLISYP